MISYLLTHSMEYSPPWETKRFSASQKIPRILRNTNFHYRIHKCTPPVPILSQLDLKTVQVRGFLYETFHNKIRFYAVEFLAALPTPKLEVHPLSAIRDWLFNIFASTLHFGGRSSIRNPRTRHAPWWQGPTSCGISFDYETQTPPKVSLL
jgi:hypothetical protein